MLFLTGLGPVSQSLSAAPLAAAILLVEPFSKLSRVSVPALFFIAVLVQAVRAASLQSLQTALIAGPERGAYIVLKNSISQAGIAAGVVAGGALFADGGSFLPVAWLSAAAGLLSGLFALPIREDISPSNSPGAVAV